MQRVKDGFLEKLQNVTPLHELSVLEIGCGNWSRSVGIANVCKKLTAIEPDETKLQIAIARNIPNATFLCAVAEALPFDDWLFDVVVFTLSLHHVPIESMTKAIDEAIRVTKSGHIVFLEPTEKGTFFDAEIQFDACDGDERIEKRVAQQAISDHPRLQKIAEFYDETILTFESVDDFVASMQPKRKLDAIEDFLTENNFSLNAERIIGICKLK